RHIVRRHMSRDPAPFLPLTPAAFHVLLALADGPKHGYLILKDVQERTSGDVRLSTGTLYGLIKRFLDDELIVELPAAAHDDERRRRYRLTTFGRDIAASEAVRLERLVSAARAVRLLPSPRQI
ncbi:MAG: PadR family transcriptional regulator, partial [Vicinamibacterales bacterium]